MIDSHVHLNHKDFARDLEDIFARASDSGVSHYMNIGFDLASSKETAAMTDRYPNVYGAVGVHPHDASTYNDEVESELETLLQKPRVVAVGEIGLDYFRDLSPRDVQQEAFRRQLRLARKTDYPIVIHCRDAFDDVLTVLREEGSRWRGIFHAFTGAAAQAAQVLEMGFHIGIGGVVTFRNSKLSEVVAGLPEASFVLETDCPYLTPMPFRGKRNEPGYLKYVIEKIASVTGRSIEEIDGATTQNFKRAVGINHG